MLIKQIELNNFRIYYGQNNIDLTMEKDRNIVIISGKNGYGKTTFLMALVWCLYGKQMQDVDEFYKKEITDSGGYAKYIANSLNRFAQADGVSQFSASITFQHVSIPEISCDELKITRRYDTQSSNDDEIEILINGKLNEFTHKDIGNQKFIHDFILPKEVAKFFLFDAEKIVSLAESTTVESRKNLSEAYSEVLGIKKYVDLKANLEEVIQRIKKESASESDRKKVNTLDAELENIEIDISNNESEITDINERLVEIRKELQEIQEKLIREGQLITQEELAELFNNREQLETELKYLNNELKEFYEIIPFAIAGETALDVMNQLEDEAQCQESKSARDNSEDKTYAIINEIEVEKVEKKLIIDTRIQEFYNDQIKILIKKHFFSESSDLPKDFSVLHEFSASKKQEWTILLRNIKTSFKVRFSELVSGYNGTKNNLSALNQKIKKAESKTEDPIINDLRKKRDFLDHEKAGYDDQLTELNQHIGALKNNYTQKKKNRDSLLEKTEDIKKDKNKYELTKRQIKHLSEFIITFQDEKKRSLEKNIFEGLQTLMHKKSFVNKVKVDILPDIIDIVLYNKRGKIIRKDSLSKGEQQMYATALLRGLVEESELEFPVFIDSPMQKFDEIHAENIVKHFYPNISEQVIILPLLKKELLELEYQRLIKNVAKTYLIDNQSEDKSIFKSVEPKKLFLEYGKM